MGMYMSLFALSAKSIAELVADPQRMPAFTQTEEITRQNNELKAKMEAQSPGQWDEMQQQKKEMLEEMKKASPDMPAFNNPWKTYDGATEGYKSLASINIDKSFQAIHFLLTGMAEGGEPPLSWLIFGGKLIGDGGIYEAERYLEPDEVVQIAEALKGKSLEEWARNFDVNRMEQLDIYPDIWAEEGKEALDGYLLPNLKLLIEFVQKAASQKHAIFKVIN